MIIVHKYGGSSVATTDKIIEIAKYLGEVKDQGHDVIVVVSAMGKRTDALISLAKEITKDPDKRELDRLMSTGEQTTIALLAIALKSLGYDAISLTGVQAGIKTSGFHTKNVIDSVDNNKINDLLKEGKIRLVLHVPVTGGQDLRDCLSGLKQTAEGIDAEIVVWLNEYKGEIKAPDGKGFSELPVYQEHKSKIIGMINMGLRNPDTYGKDIEVMVSNSLTFDEAIRSFGIMERQRLKTVKRELYEQLDKIPLLTTETEPVKTAKPNGQEA